MGILSLSVVGIVMSNSWEGTSLGRVVVGVSISSRIKVELHVVVSIEWSEKPVEWTLLTLLIVMNGLVLVVALFEQLLVDGVIIAVVFDHGGLLFEIGSRVPLIGHGGLVAHVSGESIAAEGAGCQ